MALRKKVKAKQVPTITWETIICGYGCQAVYLFADNLLKSLHRGGQRCALHLNPGTLDPLDPYYLFAVSLLKI